MGHPERLSNLKGFRYIIRDTTIRRSFTDGVKKGGIETARTQRERPKMGAWGRTKELGDLRDKWASML